MKRNSKRIIIALILVIVILLAVSAPALAEAALAVAGDAAVTSMLIDVAGTVIAAAMLAILGFVTAWLKTRLKSDRLINALVELERAAIATVGELQQVMVEGFKAANGGKLKGTQINELGQKSLALIKQRMSASAQNAIQAAGLDLQDLIRAQVEAAVTGLK